MSTTLELLQALATAKRVNAYRISRDTGIALATVQRWLATEQSPVLENVERIIDYLRTLPDPKD